jgi:hypothetical protein
MFPCRPQPPSPGNLARTPTASNAFENPARGRKITPARNRALGNFAGKLLPNGHASRNSRHNEHETGESVAASIACSFGDVEKCDKSVR